MSLAERLGAVKGQLDVAARAAGRDPASILLVAVSKRHPARAVVDASALGVQDFGENLAQELVGKAAEVASLGCAVRWHYLGRIQRNKINALLKVPVTCFHSLDSFEVAEALAKRATSRVDVLVQVNIGREPQKGGVDPDEAVALARRVAGLAGLRLRGLMGIPPADVDPAPYFEQLARLSAELVATPEGREARELSMGMTSDFTSAIAHGATMIRIGTAIFGERTARPVEES